MLLTERPFIEYTPQERAARTEYARRLLSDQFFQQILEDTERSIILSWINGANVEARERARALLSAVYAVEETLRMVASEGTMIDTPERGA